MFTLRGVRQWLDGALWKRQVASSNLASPNPFLRRIACTFGLKEHEYEVAFFLHAAVEGNDVEGLKKVEGPVVTRSINCKWCGHVKEK